MRETLQSSEPGTGPIGHESQRRETQSHDTAKLSCACEHSLRLLHVPGSIMSQRPFGPRAGERLYGWRRIG